MQNYGKTVMMYRQVVLAINHTEMANIAVLSPTRSLSFRHWKRFKQELPNCTVTREVWENWVYVVRISKETVH
jgi:transcription-repair coupling factor (superfamily II helicase)